MDDAELWRFVALLPIPGKTAVPLHRVLAHTMWRRSPLAIIHYDADQDRVLIHMVDAPTVAEAVIRDPDIPSGDGKPIPGGNAQFIGFDGTDSDSWPTVISLPDFRLRRRTGGITLTLLRRMCGEHVWQAALAAAYDATTKSAEVAIGPQECSMLIDRWRNMFTPPEATELSHKELTQTFSDWIAADPGQLGERNGLGKREPR